MVRGDSWVITQETVVRTHIRGLITPLITIAHEPASRQAMAVVYFGDPASVGTAIGFQASIFTPHQLCEILTNRSSTLLDTIFMESMEYTHAHPAMACGKSRNLQENCLMPYDWGRVCNE